MSVEDGETEHMPREALRVIRSGEAEISDVLEAISAALATGRAYAPARMIAAATALEGIKRDLRNGGLDQVVWNLGPAAAEAIAADVAVVGAVELGGLLVRLAGVCRDVQAEIGEAALVGDPVAGFLAFRRWVGGPDFDVVDPRLEVGEALREAAIEAAEEFPDPDGEAPPLRAEAARRQ